MNSNLYQLDLSLLTALKRRYVLSKSMADRMPVSEIEYIKARIKQVKNRINNMTKGAK